MATIEAQSNKCLACHTGQASQPATAMANALDKQTLHPVLNSHPKLTWQEGSYNYSINSGNGENTYTVASGGETLSIPVRWAFGAHSQTWVLEYQGKLYESRVSFYPSIGGLDVTMGDQRLRAPQNLVEAMGREISNGEATSCFQCHATGYMAGSELHPADLTPGVQCAHCHAGTTQHLNAISQGKLTSVPPKLKQLTSEDISNFCGQCHRSFSDVVRGRLFGPLNVRFQPYRLAKSKCFNGSDSRIACIACHDPHQPLVTSEASYETKCLACHGVSAANKPAGAKLCATGATTGCVGCHMPKAALPGGHQIFTDHFIHIARAGEKYTE